MYVNQGPNPQAPVLKKLQTDMTYEYIPNLSQAPCREGDTQNL